MPGRLVHRQLSLIAGAISLPIFLAIQPAHALAFELGVAVTLLPEMTPDLDISTRKFGVIGEFIGLKTYAQLIPHRYGTGKKHWTRLKLWHIFLFSHLPFIGTGLRTLLCTLPLAVVLVFFGVDSPEFWSQAGWYLLWLWLGMGWSDTWHVAADLIVSDFKETKREYWYGKKRDERLFYRKTRRLDG